MESSIQANCVGLGRRVRSSGRGRWRSRLRMWTILKERRVNITEWKCILSFWLGEAGFSPASPLPCSPLPRCKTDHRLVQRWSQSMGRPELAFGESEHLSGVGVQRQEGRQLVPDDASPLTRGWLHPFIQLNAEVCVHGCVASASKPRCNCSFLTTRGLFHQIHQGPEIQSTIFL